MLPTPDTAGIDFSHVYEPSEDSYLLLDALSQPSETQYLHDRFSSGHAPLILEVGSGSGVVLTFVAANAYTIIGHPYVLTLSTDVNAFACRATIRTMERNLADPSPASRTNSQSGLRFAFLDSLNASLTSPLPKHSVDILIFNPPYVPSETIPQHTSEEEAMSNSDKFERNSKLLAYATDGGKDGMEVTNELLLQLPHVLHPSRGVAYILLCAQNRPDAVKDKIRAWGNDWTVETIRSSGKQGGWEKLQIIRIARDS